MQKTNNTLSIRIATPADTPVLATWDAKPHVQSAKSNSGIVSHDWKWDEELQPRSDGTEFFIAEVNQQPIGFMQIINPATERSHYWGPVAANRRAIDIWIGEEAFLSRGFGTRMMLFAIEYCFKPANVEAIIIDPLVNNRRSHTFYERLGFKRMGRRQFDSDSDCYIYMLERSQRPGLHNNA